MNLELSITCLLCLTQRLPATSKHMYIGIPMPVYLEEVVERRLRSLNHVCSELRSSFIILMECTHEVVGLYPMLSNSYLHSSCFWVFWSAYSIQACNMFVFPVGYFLGHPHGLAWMFFVFCCFFFKSTFRVHSAITFIFLLPKIENEEILGYKVELKQAWFKKVFLFTVVYYEQWS